jgi:hypothetical protein
VRALGGDDPGGFGVEEMTLAGVLEGEAELALQHRDERPNAGLVL